MRSRRSLKLSHTQTIKRMEQPGFVQHACAVDNFVIKCMASSVSFLTKNNTLQTMIYSEFYRDSR